MAHSALLMQVAQCQRDDSHDQHHSRGHELFGLCQTDTKNNQQRGHEQVCEISAEAVVEKIGNGAKHQRGGERYGHCEGDLALGFDKADEAADDKQDNVNPEDGILHRGGACLKRLARPSSEFPQTRIQQRPQRDDSKLRSP